MMNVDLGPGKEFDRIRAIAKLLGPTARGLGDDCAVLDPVGDHLLLSSDLAIEGHHFRREWMTPAEIGWRAAGAALSDLAADGAEPIGVLASVGVPIQEAQVVEAIMAGVGAVAEAVGARVLGGDLSRAPVVVLDVTVLGRAPRAVTRRGCRPGDRLWVTGRLGGARAALEAWQAGREPEPSARVRFVHPMPRIVAGQWLREAGARAMLDVSDGLAGDARHLAAASGVRLDIELDHVPVDAPVVDAALASGLAPQHFAALGGEDYELLVAMPRGFSRDDARRCQVETGVVLTRIGQVVQGRSVHFTLAGVPHDLAGFDHFG